MKNVAVVIGMVAFAVTSLAFAADLPYRDRDRTRGQICSTVLRGEILTLTGTVVSMERHQGMVVETDGDRVFIYGIGPNWYWELNQIDKPTVGEDVVITAFAVPFKDWIRYIAAVITVGGETLQLRDLDTGCPLWRSVERP
jgi:hypothetical protein